MLISLFAGVINVSIAVPLIINHLLNAYLECWLVYCKSAVKSAYMGHVITKKDVTGISRISQNLLLNYAHFFCPKWAGNTASQDEGRDQVCFLLNVYYMIGTLLLPHLLCMDFLNQYISLGKTKNKYTPPPNPQINYINPSRKKRPMGKQEQERGLK